MASGAPRGHGGAGLTCSAWVHLLGVGRKGCVKAIQVLYTICSHSQSALSPGVGEKLGHASFFACHCSASLYLPHKMLVCLSLVGKISMLISIFGPQEVFE